jgi:seryl-tRNA(Sec) selenium transferase
VPQGESVLDASMMAELIVTKKEIVPQLQKVRRNRAHRADKPRRGGQPLQ